MQHIITVIILAISILPGISHAFCGFYVAKADTSLFNRSSQVVMVRDADRNVITMASDFQGNVNEFAMIVPVPEVLHEQQIHVTDHAIIQHLDAYSSPRLVEYFDDDPCHVMVYERMVADGLPQVEKTSQQRARSLGVTIEAEYTVGEYDILILSATESNGLLEWLQENDYRMPEGAESVVSSYLKQGMKFFVARVNLENFEKSGFTNLRPLQIAYTHRKFMLPIRLGTVNADGKQELFIYALTRNGRVETSNYRTVKLPSDIELPVYIKKQNTFSDFYRDMFRVQVEKEKGKAVFLEYAWNMNWCDPCAADPLSDEELRELGVFWLDERDEIPVQPMPRIIPPRPQAKNVYITRLHVRYDREHFPEDLMFQVTGNTENFQGRYILRHPWQGQADCLEAKRYLNETLPKRLREEAKNLARLTGWDINDIRKQMEMPQLPQIDDKPWWQDIWKH